MPESSEQEHAQRDAAGKFRPGTSGNARGRPVGSGWAPDLRRRLQADAAFVMREIAKRAREGDMRAAELLLSPTFAPLKPGDDATRLDAPGEGLAQQAKSIMARVLDGTLSPGQGSELLQALGAAARVVEVDDLAKRVAAIEAAQADKGNS